MDSLKNSNINMRDKLKDESYFDSFLDDTYKSLEKRIVKLNSGLIKDERIIPVKKAMSSSYLHIIHAKFSNGDYLEKLKSDFHNGIKLMNESLTSNNGKVHVTKNQYLDQYYIHIYQEVLQYLSLAYFLEVSNEDFQILVDIIDRDNISDNLYEFIIKARFPNREQKRPEEYDTKQSVILKVYDKLRKATETEDKVEASKLIKQFLEKDFYHKHVNLYNSHKSKADIYCGYWSFEAAAVVKIMGLDDSSFIDNQYYPKDLVHQTALTSKKKGLFGRLRF